MKVRDDVTDMSQERIAKLAGEQMDESPCIQGGASFSRSIC